MWRPLRPQWDRSLVLQHCQDQDCSSSDRDNSWYQAGTWSWFGVINHWYCHWLYFRAGWSSTQDRQTTCQGLDLVSCFPFSGSPCVSGECQWHSLMFDPTFWRQYYAPVQKKRSFDRYAVYVMALGHVFHLIWGTEEIDDWIFGLMGALGLELVLWEMIGNSGQETPN